jgi:hypothetical protein
MRFVGVLGLVLVLLVPSVQAHGGAGGFGHLNVDVAKLAPGANKTYHLNPATMGENVTLTRDWIFGVYAGVQGGAATRLEVRLLAANVTQASWTWTAGYHGNTTRLRYTGEYDLTVRNPTNRTTEYAFYYDQSCNCLGKLIPLPGGFVLFNYDLPKDRRAFVGFPLVAGGRAQASVATLTPGSPGVWPDDFHVLQNHEAAAPKWLNVTFKTQAADRYYVFVHALEGASLEKPMDLTPLVKVDPASSGALGVVLVMAALVVAGVGRSGRRP